MAVGTRIILDNAFVSFAGNDISGYCTRAMLHIEHNETVTPWTFGIDGESRDVATHYRWNLTLDLLTDGYDANTIDKIVTGVMPPPLGPTAGTGKAAIIVRATGGSAGSSSASNPQYAGSVAVSQWDPLGSGEIGQLIRNSRTFNGDGNLTRTPTA